VIINFLFVKFIHQRSNALLFIYFSNPLKSFKKMKHPEEVLRLFNKTDEEMLQQSDVLLDSFQENKVPFVARFPHLADPFAADWAASTATARLIAPDYASVAGQSSETNALENVMADGRNLFQTVMLYTQVAFPGDPAVLRLFGQPQYESSRGSQLKLPTLLRTLFTQVSKPEYKQVLIGKGLQQAEIDALETLAAEIVNQDIAQQKAKKARSLTANQRINAMNTVWEKMALVCMCAKLVFQNDAARYNLFLLTEGEAPKSNDAPPPD
jgi:hypothetical protein